MTCSYHGSFVGPRCSRCHRPLTDPTSVRTGIGPECRALMGKDAGGDLAVRDEFSDEFDGSVPFSRGLVLGRAPRPVLFDPFNLDRGQCVTNIPHLVVHHSPDGYEFGYGGSGPADLALNVCQLYLNMTGYQGEQTDCYDGKCWTLAFAIHQDFKRAFLAGAPKTGTTIPFERIDAWFREQITPDLVERSLPYTE